jgi:putative membrane protein
MDDRQFIEQAVIDNLTGIELGGIAISKAASEIVKEIAENLVLDNSRTTVELIDLARKKGVRMPANTDAGHWPLLDELREISNREFDKRFMEAIAGQQRTAIAVAREEIDSGKDQEIREFAARFLEKLEEHLWAVESILREDEEP